MMFVFKFKRASNNFVRSAMQYKKVQSDTITHYLRHVPGFEGGKQDFGNFLIISILLCTRSAWKKFDAAFVVIIMSANSIQNANVIM